MSAIPAPFAAPARAPLPDRGRGVVPVRPVADGEVVGPSIPEGLAPDSTAQAVRRRIGVSSGFAALVAAVVVGLTGLGSPTAAPAAAPVTASSVVVQPGQTVWDVAAAHAPAGTTTAAYAASVVEHNGLDGGEVDAWQVLLLPAG